MTSTKSETVIANAKIALADRIIDRGWIAIVDGEIAGFGEGDMRSASDDAEGDLIMPGMIELHTDHLESHYVPRPKVFWNPIAAVVSYDGQLATSGARRDVRPVRWLPRPRRASEARNEDAGSDRLATDRPRVPT